MPKPGRVYLGGILRPEGKRQPEEQKAKANAGGTTKELH
jgi:hypothetical protein